MMKGAYEDIPHMMSVNKNAYHSSAITKILAGHKDKLTLYAGNIRSQSCYIVIVAILYTTFLFRNQVSFDNTLVEEPTVTANYVDFAVGGSFKSNKSSSDDSSETAFDEEPKNLFDEIPKELIINEEDDKKMVNVYLSDYTFNSFFHQLSSYGDVVFKLHLIPEMAAFLRTMCLPFESCMGNYASINGVDEGSGETYAYKPNFPIVHSKKLKFFQTFLTRNFQKCSIILQSQ